MAFPAIAVRLEASLPGYVISLAGWGGVAGRRGNRRLGPVDTVRKAIVGYARW